MRSENVHSSNAIMNRPYKEPTSLSIVLVMSDTEQAEALCGRLRRRFKNELTLELASSALYALTTLERQKPHLIVSGAHLGDMSGRDFYAIVRADASLNDVPFILLDAEANDLTLSGRDARLSKAASATQVVRAAFELLMAAGRLSEARAPQTPDAAWANSDTDKKEVKGTLEVLTLFDLMSSLSQSKRTGELSISSAGMKGTLVFNKGNLVHATLGALVGEPAVMAILTEAERNPAARFRFISSEGFADPPFTTVFTPLNALLIKLALELDHQQESP